MTSRARLLLITLAIAGALSSCNSASTSTTSTSLSPELASVQGTWVSGCRPSNGPPPDSWVDSATISGSTMMSVIFDYPGISDCTGVGVPGPETAMTLAIGATMMPTNDTAPVNQLDMTSSSGTVRTIVQIDTSVEPNTFRIGDELGTVDGDGRLTALESRLFSRMTGPAFTLQGAWVGSCASDPGASWIDTFRFLGFVVTVTELQYVGVTDCSGPGSAQPIIQGPFAIGALVQPANDPGLAYEIDFIPYGSRTPSLALIQINTSVTPNTFRVSGDTGTTDPATGRILDLEQRIFTRQ